MSFTFDIILKTVVKAAASDKREIDFHSCRKSEITDDDLGEEYCVDKKFIEVTETKYGNRTSTFNIHPILSFSPALVLDSVTMQVEHDTSQRFLISYLDIPIEAIKEKLEEMIGDVDEEFNNFGNESISFFGTFKKTVASVVSSENGLTIMKYYQKMEGRRHTGFFDLKYEHALPKEFLPKIEKNSYREVSDSFNRLSISTQCFGQTVSENWDASDGRMRLIPNRYI